jgi:hypothetical protein
VGLDDDDVVDPDDVVEDGGITLVGTAVLCSLRLVSSTPRPMPLPEVATAGTGARVAKGLSI